MLFKLFHAHFRFQIFSSKLQLVNLKFSLKNPTKIKNLKMLLSVVEHLEHTIRFKNSNDVFMTGTNHNFTPKLLRYKRLIAFVIKELIWVRGFEEDVLVFLRLLLSHYDKKRDRIEDKIYEIIELFNDGSNYSLKLPIILDKFFQSSAKNKYKVIIKLNRD